MIKKKILSILLTLVITTPMFCLSACTDEREKYIGIEGVVTDKQTKNPYTYTTFIKAGAVLVPMVHNVPKQYWLVVSYEMDEDVETYKYKVSDSIYDEYEIGDVYIYQGK